MSVHQLSLARLQRDQPEVQAITLEEDTVTVRVISFKELGLTEGDLSALGYNSDINKRVKTNG